MELKLTLKEPYYSMTGEPGKMYELREASKWLLSRLQYPDGTRKPIDKVEFTNGYGKNRPKKKRNFRGWSFLTENKIWNLPNGEQYKTKEGDIIIWL